MSRTGPAYGVHFKSVWVRMSLSGPKSGLFIYLWFTTIYERHHQLLCVGLQWEFISDGQRPPSMLLKSAKLGIKVRGQIISSSFIDFNGVSLIYSSWKSVPRCFWPAQSMQLEAYETHTCIGMHFTWNRLTLLDSWLENGKYFQSKTSEEINSCAYWLSRPVMIFHWKTEKQFLLGGGKLIKKKQKEHFCFVMFSVLEILENFKPNSIFLQKLFVRKF